MNVNPSDIKKILLVQFRPFGDVLMAASYLEALKNTLPWAEIDFLVKQPYQEVLEENPYLSNVISFAQKNWISDIFERVKLYSNIRKRKYDLIIDQQNGTGSGQVLLFSGATYRLGWINGKWRYIYNLKGVKRELRYRASQNFDMLSPLGIKEQHYKLFYHIKPESKVYINKWLNENRLHKTKIICVSPGSPRVKKKWNNSYYTKIVDAIIENTEYVVVILWAPGELKDAKKIISHSKKNPILAPPTNFNQAAAFLKKCKLLICNDGGINHLSVAVKTPSLAIFGNTNPKIWSPEGVFQHHYHLHNPNWKRMSDTTFGISPKDVINKVENILNEI